MSATEILIADAIAAEINDPARSWAPLQVPAERRFDPWYQPEDLASLRIAVVPLDQASERATRGGLWRHDYKVTVDFQQLVPFDGAVADDGLCQALAALLEAVYDWFARPQTNSPGAHKLETFLGWDVVDVQRPEIYVPERLYDQHVWESYLELTVRGHR